MLSSNGIFQIATCNVQQIFNKTFRGRKFKMDKKVTIKKIKWAKRLD